MQWSNDPIAPPLGQSIGLGILLPGGFCLGNAFVSQFLDGLLVRIAAALPEALGAAALDGPGLHRIVGGQRRQEIGSSAFLDL